MSDPQWLRWARELAAIAQNGLTYARDDFDARRYQQVRRVAAEIAAASGDVSADDASAVFAGEAGYATPKVDVRGVCFDGEDRLLLVRERDDGRWTLPGGYADVGDVPSTAVEREVAEEAGYRVRARKLLACLDRGRHGPVPPVPFPIWKLFFACEVTGTVARDHLETSDVGWFAAAELPPLSIGRITPAMVRLCFAHHAEPDRPADFD